LKESDIGIAMGEAGSDVAKQAADIVLVDDNFSTIVSAIQEGRRVFSNISKFVVHMVSANVSEVTPLLIGLAFNDRGGNLVFPMSPIQILFNNILTR
jgi:P-type E1-E2 ATPase